MSLNRKGPLKALILFLLLGLGPSSQAQNRCVELFGLEVIGSGEDSTPSAAKAFAAFIKSHEQLILAFVRAQGQTPKYEVHNPKDWHRHSKSKAEGGGSVRVFQHHDHFDRGGERYDLNIKILSRNGQHFFAGYELVRTDAQLTQQFVDSFQGSQLPPELLEWIPEKNLPAFQHLFQIGDFQSVENWKLDSKGFEGYRFIYIGPKIEAEWGGRLVVDAKVNKNSVTPLFGAFWPPQRPLGVVVPNELATFQTQLPSKTENVQNLNIQIGSLREPHAQVVEMSWYTETQSDSRLRPWVRILDSKGNRGWMAQLTLETRPHALIFYDHEPGHVYPANKVPAK